jgi:hypothetical protein
VDDDGSRRGVERRVTEPLTFVSVVFEQEYGLLELQARSVRLFLDPNAIGEIIVIDNSARGMPAGVRSALLSEYGSVADAVRVLRSDDICAVPGAIGWTAQQVLKLSVADQLSTDHYVVLDAKNHFIDTASSSLFVAPDGRARTTAHGYENHSLRPMFEHVLTYMGLEPKDYVERFTGTITPFTFDTTLVRTMMRDVERRRGRPFADEFVANDLTEFFLYSGWLVANGRSLDDVYEFQRGPWPTIWPGSANGGGVDEAIRHAEERRSAGFAVHRRALARLDAHNSRTLAAFWTSKGLFATDADAEHFIAAFARAYRRGQFARQIRELPHRARRTWRGKLRAPHGGAS